MSNERRQPAATGRDRIVRDTLEKGLNYPKLAAVAAQTSQLASGASGGAGTTPTAATTTTSKGRTS